MYLFIDFNPTWKKVLLSPLSAYYDIQMNEILNDYIHWLTANI